MSKLQLWLESVKYLPEFLRDFHDQKNLFKCMHWNYEQSDDEAQTKDKPNWVDGHVYVIDWFLFYMASRGYTLQKTRTKLEFRDFEDFRELIKRDES